MGRPKKSQPAYLEHKASGQARVRIDGIDVYLGHYGSQESWQKYHQLLTDRAAGRPLETKSRPVARCLAVAEIVEAYVNFATSHYGKESAELSRISCATRPLLDVHGKTPVLEFSPLKLQQVLDRLVLQGDTRKHRPKDGNADGDYRTISRTTVNDYLQVIKRVFKWGVSQELVPGSVYSELDTVEGIRKGRGDLAKRTHGKRKILPVAEELVNATLPFCQPEIATMIRVQLLAGMRPDEVTIMRPCDLERPANVKCWTYKPATHKNTWREGHDRVILLGPQAQALLSPFLEACRDDDYLFSPRRVADRWNKEQVKATGKRTAFSRLNALRPPRECYDDHSYRQAVKRACKRAKVELWTPGQLRHTAGTRIRAKHGLEASKIALGHRHMQTTEVYAEKDLDKYSAIMAQLG